MSIATITTTSYVSPTSQSVFLSTLDTAMGVAGFTLYDTKTISTTLVRIYSINLSAATQGTVYLKCTLNSTNQFFCSLMVGWNTGTNTATNEGIANSAVNISFTNLNTITYKAISSDELKGVLITQGTSSFLAGVIRPANWEPWYNENLWTKAFNASNVYTSVVYSTTLVPGSANTGWNTNMIYTSNLNPYNANLRQVKPIDYYHFGSYGSTCTTSNDLVMAASGGVTGTGTDQFVTSGATYLHLGNNTATGNSLAVRIA